MVKKLKILADNHQIDESLKMCWGFSCLISPVRNNQDSVSKDEISNGVGETLLFDTGESKDVLDFNMQKMEVQAEKIKKLVISHDHFDHTGGLEAAVKKNSGMEVYLLSDFSDELKKRVSSLGAKVVENDEFMEIEEGIYTTGRIEGEYGGSYIPEQAMVIKSEKGLVIITGCSHPLVTDIIETVKKKFPEDKIYLVFGGFHLLDKDPREVELIAETMKNLGVEKVGATHCTGEEAIRIFREKYSDNFVSVGVGAVLEV